MTTTDSGPGVWRCLKGTPEQLAAIQRILDGKMPPTMPAPVEAPPAPAPAPPVLPDASLLPVVPPVEPFIGKAEAAQRLGIKQRTLDQWLKVGRVPFYRIGRSVRLRWSEIQAHLADTCRVNRRSGGRTAKHTR